MVDTVPLETLAQSPLRSLIDKVRDQKVPDPLFFQIFAHVPGYAEALFDALYRSHMEGNVDHKLKEIIRIRLARLAGDQYFSNLRSEVAIDAGLTEEIIEAGCGDFEGDKRFSEAEKWALSYAKLMYTEPKKVNKGFYQKGKTYYSEAEIMELGAFIAFHYGLQVFMRTIKAFPLHDKDGNLMTHAESRKYYSSK
jgi:alkylhydroperoxidase family enzyme